ncbi:MAG: poly-gamma-glutamate synthase PgsB [Planctomycetota bacterium]
MSALALAEAWMYRRLLMRIPVRIHVNGTRGKSSVTRLIAAGMRAGGVRTCAKTTGTLARMIFHDGRELPIFRPDRANIIEQKRIVRAAVADDAEALVIECMALQPLLQSVCELKLVRSTHGVITNARADHLDVMGPTRFDVATALAGTTPTQGVMFTAEDRDDALEVFRRACRDRQSRIHAVTPEDASEITSEEMARFTYLEHAENVALALRVCQSMGIQRDVALSGMWTATPDPGAMRVHQRLLHETSWLFVNGFAANDPQSSEQIWRAACDNYPSVTRRIVVMNCRVDRPDRSKTMAHAAANWTAVDQFVILGSGTDVFLRGLLSKGVDPDRIICLGNADGEELTSAIIDAGRANGSACELASENHSLLLVGIGNVAGVGFEVANYFESECPIPIKADADKTEQSSMIIRKAPLGTS